MTPTSERAAPPDTLDSLLDRLEALDVRLSAGPDGALRYDAPQGALTDALLDEMRSRKPELIARLSGPEVTDRAPVSDQQARMIAGHYTAPDAGVWNIPTRIRFTGPLDPDALRTALAALTARHQGLCTRFVREGAEGQEDDGNGGVWWQEVVTPPPLDLPVDDLTHLPAAERWGRRDALCRETAAAGFDLTRPVLPRLRLIRTAPDEWALMFVLHHICVDGWSLSILLAEIAELYTAAAAGTPHSLPPPASQSTDYARWQRARYDPAADARRAAHCAAYLDGVPARIDIPTAHPRPDRLSGRGDTTRGLASGELRSSVEEFAAARHTTPFAVAAAALGVFLARLSGERDILLGVPYANREATVFEGLVAMTSTALMVRVRLDPDESCAALVARTGAGAMEAMANVLPTARIMQAMRDAGARDVPDRVPYVLAFQNSVDTDIEIPGLGVEVEDLAPPLARSELCFGLAPRKDPALGYRTFLEYSADLWDAEAAEALLAAYITLLSELCSRPDAPVVSLLQATGKAETA
ncbi:condensation domain-containing protein [Streptomyces sp. NPDC055287]